MTSGSKLATKKVVGPIRFCTHVIVYLALGLASEWGISADVVIIDFRAVTIETQHLAAAPIGGATPGPCALLIIEPLS